MALWYVTVLKFFWQHRPLHEQCDVRSPGIVNTALRESSSEFGGVDGMSAKSDDKASAAAVDIFGTAWSNGMRPDFCVRLDMLAVKRCCSVSDVEPMCAGAGNVCTFG